MNHNNKVSTVEEKRELVSIIVPVYNAEKTIKRCVQSIICQTYSNIEVIVINDGSNDKSLHIMEELKKLDKRICIINKKNTGVSDTRNIGINSAKGQWIMFVDADDYIDANTIEEMYNNRKKDILVGINYKIIFPKKTIYVKQKGFYYEKQKVINSIISGDFPGYIIRFLFEKEILKKIHFDVNTYYMEDTLFLVNYLKYIKGIYIVGKSCYNYVFNNKSITNSKENIIKNIKKIDYSVNAIQTVVKKEYQIEHIENNIFRWKMRLLEAEFAKVENIYEIKDILKDEEILTIFRNIDKKYLSQIYKLILYLIVNKRNNCLNIYFRIRRIIKKCKNLR